MTTPGQSSGTQKPAIVYQAVNLINGKRYIGITSRSLAQRRHEHLSDARVKKATCVVLHKAIRRYGEENISFTVICSMATFDEAKEIEKQLIASTRPEYNISSGGDGNPGRILSAEVRAKMSAARMGRPAHNKGVPHTESTKRLIGQKNSGHQMPPQTRAALAIGRAAYLAMNVNKMVQCINDGLTYPSATAASLAYGWRPTAVSNAIGKTGGRMRSKGMAFAYVRTP